MMPEFGDSLNAVGIEIELERVPSYIMDNIAKYWHVTDEGSLRGGEEFVSRILRGGHVAKALRVIRPILMGSKSNWRCAVHVHVDVRGYSSAQLANVLAGYLIFEKLLYAWEGTGRETSKYCVPAFKVPSIVEEYARFSVSQKNPRGCKYQGLNVLPQREQGSIEFRFMTTPRSITRIMHFAQLCSSLVTKFGKVQDKVNPLGMLSELGVDGFISHTFPDHLVNALTTLPDYKTMIWSGAGKANFFMMRREYLLEETEKTRKKVDTILAGVANNPPSVSAAAQALNEMRARAIMGDMTTPPEDADARLRLSRSDAERHFINYMTATRGD